MKSEATSYEKMSWYVIMTKPGAEGKVAEQLTSRAGLQVYYPRIKVMVTRGRRTATEIRPLFPRYIFSKLLILDQWKLVSYTRGVTRILGGWREPKPVTEEIIQAIKGREETPEKLIKYYNFKPSDPVYVRHGPLKELYGIFERYVDDKGRVKVLLSMVGYQASVNIDAHYLEKI
jgi:transcription antitermination factor NusG